MPFSHRKDLGLLVLRLGTAGVLLTHGSQKLLGWFGGGGLEGTAASMESMGFTPGRESAIAAAAGETGGGALLALGLATPVAGAAAAGAMAGAVAVHAPAGFFAHAGGIEYPAFLGFVAAALGLAGPGHYSVDRLTGNCLNRPGTVLLAFAVSAAAATVVVNRRVATLAAAAEAESRAEAPGLSSV
ncbi:DoxX family membrane protein [Streptomyces sp. NPDC049040]|uniref:DoxX family membrane protein n=1 Tax=Streptomyces sp. NPDC049040 TaxID=3365593 RepID=UPI003711D437